MDNRPSVEAAPGVVIPFKFSIPPAVLAHRMQRYALYLMICAFLLMALNFSALSLEAVLWFAAGLAAVFALLCATSTVLLNAMQWDYERLKEEMRGGRQSTDMR